MPNVIGFIYWGIQALILLVVISSILSWFRPDPSNPLMKILNAVVERRVRSEISKALNGIMAVSGTSRGKSFYKVS